MLRTLIVDDEAPARERLARLLRPLEEAGRLALVGEVADGEAALRRIAEGGVDLVFLDVQMPGPDGFAVLERLPPQSRPAVVFATAYDRYAVRAFDANAVDYLLKPVEAERLAASVARVEALRARGADGRRAGEERLAELLEYLDRQSIGERPAAPAPGAPASPAPAYLEQLTVPGRDRLLVVPVADLLAAEVQDGITRLFTLAHPAANAPAQPASAPPSVQRHLVGYPLETLEARLDPAQFVRVHRAALVQVRHIREMIPWFSGRFKLVLAGGHEVIASRARSKELRDRLSL